MLSIVNDRSLSTNSYYTGSCPRLCTSPPLCCWATISNSTGTATSSREHGSASGRSQHGRQAAGHRRGADRSATTGRRPSVHSRIMVIMRTPSAEGRSAGASAAPGGGSSDGQESTATGGDPAGTPPFSGGELFSIRYRVLATLPPQSFISSFNTLTTPPQPSQPLHPQ